MTKEDLKNYRYAQKWVEEQIERYQEQRTIALNIIQKIDGLPKAHNKTNYALENLIDQYEQMINILTEEQKKQNAILNQIRFVKEPYRSILTDKYLKGFCLEEISENIHYSYERTCKMHGKALEMFEELNTSGQ